MITLGARRERERARLAATEQWRADAVSRVGYFTDGAELYRVNRWLERPSEPRLAEVENCRSLDCVLLSCDDLARLPVRMIAVAATAEGSPPAAWPRSLELS
jgi:hypothetical protein